MPTSVFLGSSPPSSTWLRDPGSFYSGHFGSTVLNVSPRLIVYNPVIRSIWTVRKMETVFCVTRGAWKLFDLHLTSPNTTWKALQGGLLSHFTCWLKKHQQLSILLQWAYPGLTLILKSFSVLSPNEECPGRKLSLLVRRWGSHSILPVQVLGWRLDSPRKERGIGESQNLCRNISTYQGCQYRKNVQIFLDLWWGYVLINPL